MSRTLPLSFFVFCAIGLRAQTGQTAPPSPASSPAPQQPELQRHPAADQGVQASGVTLTAGTQLVVVDVVVEDKSGHPIHGLKASDFLLLEGKTPQSIKTFDEHSTPSATELANVKIAKLAPMPAGIFTDYTPVPETGALNVLLLDALNTPMKDQSYVRYQLQEYEKHLTPGTRIAIFGMNTRLTMLQGFSSDPEVLKNAVEHKLTPRASNLLDDPVGTGNGSPSIADGMSDAGASASAVANVQQFEADEASFQTQVRTQYTLDAFNQLARYLAQFPGRKNVIWFSGAFPLTIFPDSSLGDPFSVEADASDELRETTSLLDRARVAVYPIDARGLQTLPMFQASTSGRNYARNPSKLGNDISNFNNNNAQEHASMDQIASETGGHAFYNTNGLTAAVQKALEAGSNYYTITYSPLDKNWKGEYRTIHVKLQGDFTTKNLKLAYRNGYYAEDPNNRKTAALSPILSGAAAAVPPPGASTGAAAYARMAIQRGAPTPSEILFKVRVLPASTATDATILPHNSPNPALKQKGPFRVYDVDIAALAANIAFHSEADGRIHGKVEFVTYVYDADGTILNIEGSEVDMNLLPARFAELRKTGMNFGMQVSAPARGESFLRIAVHDLSSGHYGVVEVPTSSVSRLTPPPAVVAPPATPAATPPPTQ